MTVFKKKTGIILALVLIVVISLPFPVYAQGDLAMAGTFSGWKYNVTPGAEVASDDVFVIIFNNTDNEIVIDLSYVAPQEVEVTFSENHFSITPGESKRIIPTVKVSSLAVPGQYDLILTATATALSENGSVGVSTALGQKADLNIAGESATVKLQAVSPDMQPLVTVVKLFRIESGRNYEVANSNTGMIDTRVSPGNYNAAVYVGDAKMAEESFSLFAGEAKEINLSASTVYFEGFGIVPAYQNDTGEIAFAKVVYTIKNYYKQIDNAEVILDVSRDSKSLEEVTLANLSPLDTGSAGLNYNYIPAGGWQNGNYSFKLRLNLDGKPYTDSLEQQLNVKSSTVSKGGINPIVIGSIAGGLLVVAISSFLLLRRLRRP